MSSSTKTTSDSADAAPPVDQVSVVAKPTLNDSPSVYLPQSNIRFVKPFTLYIGHVGQGSNASLNRDLMNASDFPDLARFTNPFLNVRIVSHAPGSEVSGGEMLLFPAADHQGIFRAVSVMRPASSSVPASFQSSVCRPGAAFTAIGSNSTFMTVQNASAWLTCLDGISDMLKGPVVAEYLPRFDFRFEGFAGSSVDVYLRIVVEMWGAGYGYTQ